jgi:hypothetical protein
MDDGTRATEREETDAGVPENNEQSGWSMAAGIVGEPAGETWTAWITSRFKECMLTPLRNALNR